MPAHHKTETDNTRSIVLLTLSRLTIDMTRRFVYPFVGPIAAQLGVSPAAVQNVLASQAGIGLTSPLFGTLAERYGRKRVMVLCLLAMVVAALIGAFVPQFSVFVLVMLTFGMGKVIFNPTMQAYIGDIIPYSRRGRALGIVELSWAGALFVVAPLAGFILERSTLQLLMLVFAILLGVMTLAMFFLLSSDAEDRKQKRVSLNPFIGWGSLLRSPAAIAALIFSLTLVGANELFFINYGLYMEAAFDLPLTALGTVTIVVALAEALGEGMVIMLADRIGKRPLTLIGAFGAAIAYVLLPQFNSNLFLTLASLFLMFACVEMAIVASFPLFTEVLPEARTVMMSTIGGAHALGRMAGASLGGMFFASTGNFGTIGLASLIIGMIAFIMMWRFIPEYSHITQ